MSNSKAPVRPLGGFEKAVLAHTGIFLVGATWALGGNDGTVRLILTGWGGIGALLTLAAATGKKQRTQISLKPLRLLWPAAAFNALVLLSCLTPLLREVHFGSSAYLTTVPAAFWKPGAAEPERALRALWLFDAIYISCFNLLLVVRHRRVLRGLLLILAANAAVLSVFGTLQKLFHAKGLFFGLVRIENADFFASFIYHNHWGAFAILAAGAILGLARHYERHLKERGALHSPVLSLILILLVVAITVPLAGSRSSSILLAGLLLVAFGAWLRRLSRNRRHYGESMALPLAGALIALVFAVGVVWYLANDVIIARLAATASQVAVMKERGDIGGRNVLYADTWRMAEDKMLFGWGMDSYPHVFWMYNTQPPNPVDHIPVYYHDAHSDWLQSLAEHGLIGSAALALCALVPLFTIRLPSLKSPLALYVMSGCGLLLLYAWFEFPFGNTSVVLCWWLCFFGALRYAQLEENKRELRDTVSPVGGTRTPSALERP